MLGQGGKKNNFLETIKIIKSKKRKKDKMIFLYNNIMWYFPVNSSK